MTESERAELNKIKFLVFDFDGVMTNNQVWLDETGREYVVCNRGDGMGIALLRESGFVQMAVISTEHGGPAEARCKKLQIPCFCGVRDKLLVLRREIAERGISAEETAYIGNDINDRSCMEYVGVAFAVADAHPAVLAVADRVTRLPGGAGAVREVCDLFLSVHDGLKG